MLIKKIMRGLALFFFSLVLALSAAEIFLRCFPPRFKHLTGTAQPQGELIRPSAKILILGDSFLANLPGRMGFYEMLEQDLRPDRVQLLNTAVPGSGPADYWIALQAYAGSFNPDAVLLFYYAGNDLTNVQYRLGPLFKIKLWLKPLVAKSVLFSLISESRDSFLYRQAERKRQKNLKESRIVLPPAKVMNPGFFDLSREKPDYVRDNLLISTPENQKAWGIGRGLLEKIERYCRRRKIKLYLIALPSMAQVHEKHFTFYESVGLRVDRRMLTESVPQDLLRAFSTDHQIPYLDLLPAFRENGTKSFFAAADDHFGPEGARFAADQVLQFLKAEGLLKTGAA